MYLFLGVRKIAKGDH